MKRIVLGAAVVAMAASGLAYAASHGDAIQNRKMAMKSVGGAMGTMVKMVKGEMPFDANGVIDSLKKINEVTKSFGNYFPVGSETGMDSEGKETTVSPKIWEDMDGFKAKIAKLDMDTAAAIAIAPKSVEELGPVLGSVGGNCKSCHETFRVKK